MTLLPGLLALKQDGSIRPKLVNHLPARATRRAWHSMVVDYSNRANLNFGPKLSDSGENGRPLRAVRKPVRSVLHITTGEDFALRREKRRANMKVRIWSVGVLHRLARRF